MRKIHFLFPLLFPITAVCQQAVITGNIKNVSASSVKCSFIPTHVFDKVTAITIPVNNGQFKQILPVKSITFISIEEGNNFYGGYIEPGDSIHIIYDASQFKNTLSLSGRGKEKFLLASELNDARAGLSLPETSKDTIANAGWFLHKADSVQARLTASLDAARHKLGETAHHQLKGYLASMILRTKYNGIISLFGDAFERVLKNPGLPEKSYQDISRLLVFDDHFSDSYFYVSYLANLLSGYYNDNVRPQAAEGLSYKYRYLSDKLPGGLKSPVLYLLLEKEVRQYKDTAIGKIAGTVFSREKDKRYKVEIIRQLAAASALKAGDPAPDFTLEDVNGRKVGVHDFVNKVVLIDFWFEACGPCHKLFNALKPVKETYRSDSNMVFLVVSVDNKDTWKRAMARFNIEGYHAFTGGKFREHPMIKAYHVTEYPATFLIGKDGKILNADPFVSPDSLKTAIRVALEKE